MALSDRTLRIGLRSYGGPKKSDFYHKSRKYLKTYHICAVFCADFENDLQKFETAIFDVQNSPKSDLKHDLLMKLQSKQNLIRTYHNVKLMRPKLFALQDGVVGSDFPDRTSELWRSEKIGLLPQKSKVPQDIPYLCSFLR